MRFASFVAALERHARQRPAAPALAADDRIVGYGELFAQAVDFQAQLEIEAAQLVCIRAHRSAASIALILANLIGGRPVLLASPELGETALELLATRAGAGYILAVEDGALSVRPAVPGSPDGPVAPDAGLLLTTSGSTGMPKVVPLPVAAVDRFIAWATERFEIRPGHRILSYAPLNFDLSLLEVWTTLHTGACAVLVDQDRAADGGYLRRLITEHEVHLVQGVPLLYRLLHDPAGEPAAWSAGAAHVISTGDALPATLLAALPERFPKARLYNVYGCTETNDSFLYEIPADAATPLPLGEPITGVRAYLAGPDGQALDGPGTGELVVHTPFQTAGYLDPQVGVGRFLERADADRPRTYYRSGDLVRRDADGTLMLVGRSDFQVKVRGVRVNVAEVEEVILAHENVVEAAVVALLDEVAGNRLYALVRRAPGTKTGSLALRAHCARHLVRTAIPTDMRVVDTPLPKGPTGKVDRGVIRLRAAQEIAEAASGDAVKVETHW